MPRKNKPRIGVKKKQKRRPRIGQIPEAACSKSTPSLAAVIAAAEQQQQQNQQGTQPTGTITAIEQQQQTGFNQTPKVAKKPRPLPAKKAKTSSTPHAYKTRREKAESAKFKTIEKLSSLLKLGDAELREEFSSLISNMKEGKDEEIREGCSSLLSEGTAAIGVLDDPPISSLMTASTSTSTKALAVSTSTLTMTVPTATATSMTTTTAPNPASVLPDATASPPIQQSQSLSLSQDEHTQSIMDAILDEELNDEQRVLALREACKHPEVQSILESAGMVLVPDNELHLLR